MKVLVTGGSGFIGSHIVDAMIEEGHSVAVIDDLSSGSPENLNSRARLYDLSITDSAAVEKVIADERPELVSHHAAQTDVRRSMADPLYDATVNALGTINLLQLSVQHGVTRFIFASTCAVYSEPRYMPMDESHPIGPQSAYGASKHTAENYIRLYADVHGLRYKIFRYGNVYGPRQNPGGEAGVVAIFAGELISGAQPTIFGDGTKTRDYVFVQDIVAANLKAMGEGGDNEVLNLSWGREVSDFQIFEAVRMATGASTSPRYAPKRPGEAYRVSLDSSRAAKALGWRPTVRLEEGVQRSVSYYRASGFKK